MVDDMLQIRKCVEIFLKEKEKKFLLKKTFSLWTGDEYIESRRTLYFGKMKFYLFVRLNDRGYRGYYFLERSNVFGKKLDEKCFFESNLEIKTSLLLFLGQNSEELW